MKVRLARSIITASLATVLALGGGAAGAQTPAHTTLRIAMIPSEVTAPIYYARDLGYFKDAGIDVEVTPISSGAAISAAVLSGAVDIGFASVFSLAIAHEKGLALLILAGSDVHKSTDATNGLLAVPKTSTIRTAKDFAGKTIAVSGLTNITYYALRTWIDKNGGDSKASKYVEFPTEQDAAAVVTRRVDAAVMDAANANSAEAKANLRVITNTFDAIAPEFIPAVWFSTAAFTKDHPQTAQQFMAIVRKAAIWANAHPHDAIVRFAKYSRFTLTDLEAAPRPSFATSLSVESLQPALDVAAKYGAIKAPLSARELISPLALPER